MAAAKDGHGPPPVAQAETCHHAANRGKYDRQHRESQQLLMRFMRPVKHQHRGKQDSDCGEKGTH
jgi:hypothetical protein